MTNGEKYLKDEVEAKEIWHKYQEFLMNNDKTENACTFVEFMEEQSKPTLTEDERVILRNIDKTYTHISRTYGDIWVGIGEETADSECKRVCVFNHLFQFIKERRRIFH